MKNIFVLFFLILTYYTLFSQEKSEYNSKINPELYVSKDILRAKKSSFLEIRVSETDDSTAYYSNDFGGAFSYRGNLIGGIKNLLQTNIGTIPHVKFLNYPNKNNFIEFNGTGLNMSYKKLGDTISCPIAGFAVDGRELILNILAKQYNFSIIQSQDSIEKLLLHIIDTNLLMIKRTPQRLQYLGGYGRIDSTSHDYISNCGPLLFLTWELERKWNIMCREITEMKRDGYDFIIPAYLLNSIENLDLLNQFLKQNLGLKIEKTKIFDRVFLIKFDCQ